MWEMATLLASNLQRAVLLTAALALLLTALAPPALGQGYRLEFGERDEAVEMRLSVGKSQIIRSAHRLDQVVIGNPDIADIRLLTDRQVLILGIKPGHTNMVFKDRDRNMLALWDVVVSYDLSSIKRKLSEILPHEDGIEVRGSNDRVILSGNVRDARSLEKAVAVAHSYAPEDKVVNMLQVGGGHQVMLEVKVAEVSRTSLRELGVETTISNVGSRRTTVFESGDGISPAFGVVDFTDLGSSIADFINLRLTALERKGLARTLAEPNIVAISGQEANFLVGGEVPVPVPQASVGVGSITISYKEFGVGLRFTPTVLSPEHISLRLVTEVSAIDASRSFSLGGGLEVPSFSTRRAGSTVEMADGQSFAIAGLLQDDIIESIRQFPFLGDIPIIGALFRSASFRNEETELVVIVTPRLVSPAQGGTLSSPVDNFIPPSLAEFYLLGRMEGLRFLRPGSRKRERDEPVRETSNANAGFQGAFGHE
jgi:pilus assembly protein CpaC